jgi:hypothetical protein
VRQLVFVKATADFLCQEFALPTFSRPRFRNSSCASIIALIARSVKLEHLSFLWHIGTGQPPQSLPVVALNKSSRCRTLLHIIQANH